MPDLYVGLMSGTSLDGVDAALVDLSIAPGILVANHFLPYPEDVRAEALALNSPGANEIERAAMLANRLAELYSDAVGEMLESARTPPASVVAIGCHGQTVRHRPDLGFTVQLVNAALLAERTGVRVVADFRSRDVAARGQGAPLVPAYHAACFARPDRHRVVVNIGGIANVTDLAPGRPVIGFDTGPGNALLDAWAASHLGAAYDAGGEWARSGKIIEALARGMLADPYFDRHPPKSTGRDLFNAAWLEGFDLARHRPEDVQATLAAVTARGIADAIHRYCGGADEVLLCGGGLKNRAVVAALREALPATIALADTGSVGVDPDWVEAMAFAWLAREALAGRPGNLSAVTGAAGPRVLGAIYPR